MSTIKKVWYRGRQLGELTVYELGDWRNASRPAADRDLRLMNATSAADFLRSVLEREPLQADPGEPDLPWVMVVLREACTASVGTRDQRMEEHTLLLYVERHGMDQILGIWGADLGVLKGEIEKMLAIEDAPS